MENNQQKLQLLSKFDVNELEYRFEMKGWVEIVPVPCDCECDKF